LLKASNDPITAGLVQNYLNKQEKLVKKSTDGTLPRLSNSLQNAGALQVQAQASLMADSTKTTPVQAVKKMPFAPIDE
jgi:hypothetical protein